MLDLIDRGRTNIMDVCFFQKNYLVSTKYGPMILQDFISPDIDKSLLKIRDEFLRVEKLTINDFGKMENIIYRNDKNIYCYANILFYPNERILVPKSLKYDIVDSEIWTIEFHDVTKHAISEDDIDNYLEQKQILVSNDEGQIQHLKYKNIYGTKYWVENPFKAIFFMKKNGYSLNIDSIDKDDTDEFLMSVIQEDEFIMTKEESIVIIKKVAINSLSELLRSQYQKRNYGIPKVPSLKKYKVSETDLEPDVLDDKYDKLKMPRRTR